MNAIPSKPGTIDEYIADYPPDVQEILQKIRAMIHEGVPDVQEAIKYHMPTFLLNGKGVIAFAVWKKHIAIYATPRGTEEFRQEIAPYTAAKSTMQFPLNKPMPYTLIGKAIDFRVKEHLENMAEKGKK